MTNKIINRSKLLLCSQYFHQALLSATLIINYKHTYPCLFEVKSAVYSNFCDMHITINRCIWSAYCEHQFVALGMDGIFRSTKSYWHSLTQSGLILSEKIDKTSAKNPKCITIPFMRYLIRVKSIHYVNSTSTLSSWYVYRSYICDSD